MDRPLKSLSLLPDFLVIGAMKCATTTLHEQLARQPGLFMSRPKEPNFFSDDEVYARGLGWYTAIFRDAKDHQLRGEASTHYTKLPTYPSTVERMVRVLPRVKLIYVMRHPIDRLASHYLHELTVGRIKVGLEQAVDQHPELVDYGRYSISTVTFFLRLCQPTGLSWAAWSTDVRRHRHVATGPPRGSSLAR